MANKTYSSDDIRKQLTSAIKSDAQKAVEEQLKGDEDELEKIRQQLREAIQPPAIQEPVKPTVKEFVSMPTPLPDDYPGVTANIPNTNRIATDKSEEPYYETWKTNFENKKKQQQTAETTYNVINPTISPPAKQTPTNTPVTAPTSLIGQNTDKANENAISNVVKQAVESNPPKEKKSLIKKIEDFNKEWNIAEVITKAANAVAPDSWKYVSGKAGAGITEGIASGVDSGIAIYEGIKHAITDDTYEATDDSVMDILNKYKIGKTNYLSGDSTQLDYVDRINEMLENEAKDLDKGMITNLAADLGYNLGRMAPAIYAAAVGNTFGMSEAAVKTLRGAISYSTSSTRAIKNALDDGASPDSAIAYGTLSGIIESAGEELIGGFLGTGAGIVDTGIKKVAGRLGISMLNNVKNPIVKGVMNYAGSALGEGIEEMVQEMLDIGAQKITYNPEAEFNANEIAYAGLLGTLMGGIYSLPQAYRNTRQAYNTNQYIKNVAQSASKIDSQEGIDEALNIIYAQYKTGETLLKQVQDWDIDKGQKDFIITNIDYFNNQMKNLGSSLYQNQEDIINKNKVINENIKDNNDVKMGDDVVYNSIGNVKEAIDNNDIVTVNSTVANAKNSIRDINNTVRNNNDLSDDVKKAVLDSLKENVNELNSMSVAANNAVYENKIQKINDLMLQDTTHKAEALQLLNEMINENNDIWNVTRNRTDIQQAEKNAIIDILRNENSSLRKVGREITNDTYQPVVEEAIEEVDIQPLKSDSDNSIIEASQADLESTIIDDTSEHAPSMEKIIEDYKASVDDGLINFINYANSNPKDDKSSYELSPPSEQLVKDVNNLLGIDISEYTNNIRADTVHHINRRHGESGKHDHTMADINDVARIDYVLNNYDTMHSDISKSRAHHNADGSNADTVLISKKIDGRYYVVEAVPNNKSKKLQVVSAYMQKNKDQQSEHQMHKPPTHVQNDTANVDQSTQSTSDVQVPLRNVQNDSIDVDPSNIPQDTENVNSETAKYNLTLKDYAHSKTGDKYILAVSDNKLSTDDFKKLSGLIKDSGGYYSKFAKGFLLNSDKDINDIKQFATVTDTRNNNEEITSNEQRDTTIVLENENSGNNERVLSESASELEETGELGREPQRDSEISTERISDNSGLAERTESGASSIPDGRTDTSADIVSVPAEHMDSPRDSGGNVEPETRGDSGRLNVSNSKKISANMTDTERYEILKDKVIEISKYQIDSIDAEDIEKLTGVGSKIAKPLIKKITESFDVFKEYHNNDIDIEFEFSRRGLTESINKQKYNFDDFAKIFANFDDIIKNAVGIEVHGERYASRDDSSVDNIYVLLGAYKESKDVTPIRLTVKEYNDGTKSKLYVVIGFSKIKEADLSVHTDNIINDTVPYTPSTSIYSISSLLQNVNPNDGDLLKYIPDNFLNEAQLDGKHKALEAEKKYIENKLNQAAQNYHFADTDIDTFKPNFNVNIKAIELSKLIASEGRNATAAEQKILAGYKGWGGLKDAFLEGSVTDRKLRELLSKEEYQSARSSIQSAFYTPLELVNGMYEMLSRLGFEKGRILEPSMGTGNFFGAMPKTVMNGSKLFGVEYDPLTGQIAQQLYPLAKIEVSPFEDVNFTDNIFDLVIGNVPFVNVSYKYKKGSYQLHDLFFIKSLDKVKSNGVVMLLTSTGTLDKANSKVRDELSKKADLIAAFRLPHDIFKPSAGINVMTDLIILQKRPAGIQQNDETFSQLNTYMDVPINEYFARHPENILGEINKAKNQFGKDELRVSTGKASFNDLLQIAANSLPKNIMNRTVDDWKDDIESEIISQSESPKFLLDKKDNPIFHDPVTNTDKKLTGKDAVRAKHYINISEAYDNLLKVSTGDYTAEQRNASRMALNDIYDTFVNDKSISNNPNRLNDKANENLLSDDIDYWKVAGLERFDPHTKAFVKSDLLTKDTLAYARPEHASTSHDAVAISINEKGKIDLTYIEKLTGFNKERILKDIKDIAVETPDGGYELIPQYTSGYIREKLNAAKKAASKDGKFTANVRMLEAALPKKKIAAEIIPQFGASWIGAENVHRFIYEVFGNSAAVNYDPFTGTWTVDNFHPFNISMNKKFSTDRAGVHKIVETALNQKPITIKDKFNDREVINVQETALARQKISELKDYFSEWLFKDKDRRDALVDTFNEKFNDYKAMDYGAMSKYLELPGLADEFTPRDYQRDAVARVVFGGDTLLAHGVGTGKTAEMIMSAMELKRMGIANKIMMVVPNNKIGDFRTDILKTYPAAKVLMATEKDFKKENRARLFSKIGTNDWDIVVVGHSSFKQISVNPDTQREFLMKELEEIEQTISSATSESGRQSKKYISQLEKSKTAAEQRIKNLLDYKRDNTLTFEEMGVDALFVDEAHNFKNLPYYTKLNVSGVGSVSSQRAEDMYMKTNYIRGIDGRIVFATATPITNSIAEMYNMTRFVRPDALKQAGLQSFDAWAATFGETVSKPEVSPDGRSIRIKERFSKYNNATEMIGLFRQFADVLRTEDVVTDLPKAKYVEVVSPSTPIHEKYIDAIMTRINRMSSGQKQSDNMLLVTNDGRAMATDMRLVASQIPNSNIADLDIPTSRINKAVGNILSEYKASGQNKGTQFVFLDFGMSDGDGKRYNYNLYSDIKKKLIKGGIPSAEIADINDYDTAIKKEALFEKMNKGEVRVLMGSTAKMGEGVNAQKKAVALHHLNAPYRPSDIEQREGRIIRYGNENPDVTIYKYIQEKSFDSYMWQMLARKGMFINQAMSGVGTSSLEEIDDFVLSAQNAMAIATGNPLILRQIEVDQELKQLTIAKNAYLNEQNHLQDRIAMLPNEIRQMQELISSMKTDAELSKTTAKDSFKMIIGNTSYIKQGEAGDAILKQFAKKTNKVNTAYDLGKYRGFDIKYSISDDGKNYIYIDGATRYSVTASDSNTGIIARISNAINDIPKNLKTNIELERVKREEHSSAKNELGQPFPKQTLLDKLNAELININTQLTQDTGISPDGATEVFDASDDSDTEVDAYIGYVAQQNTKADDNIWRRRERTNKKNTDAPPDLSLLARSLSVRFGIPINKGKLKTFGASGEYNPKTGTIRVRTENAIPVLAHELGHYFDNKYKLTVNKVAGLDTLIDQYANKLIEMGYEDKDLKTESLAEYFRDYISNKDTTTELFPEFTNTAKSILTKVDWRNLTAYANEVNQYLSATQEERFKSTIHKRQTHNKYKEQADIFMMNPKSSANKALDMFVYNWIDMYSTVKYAELKSGGTTKVYDQIMQSNNMDLKVEQSVLNGIRDLNGSIVGAGLREYMSFVIKSSSFKPSDTKEDFSLYLKNRHAAELVDRGVRAYADDTLNNQDAIQKSISALDNKYPAFDQAAQGIYEFQNTVNYEYAVKTGLISEEQYNRMTEVNKNYVPFFRVLSTFDLTKSELKEIRKGVANQVSPIKRIRGSGLDTYDPIENILYNTTAIMKAGTRNAIMRDLADLADNTPDFGVYMEKIPPDMVANVTSLKSVKDKIASLPDNVESTELKEIFNKLDDWEVDLLIDTVIDNVGDTIKVFKSKRSNKNNVISVKRNGEYEYYEVHDEYMLKALQSLSPGTSSIVMETMRKLTSSFKALTTGANPFFAVSNIIRDFPTGYISSDTTKNPIKYTIDWVTSAVGVIFESKNYKDYLANGGGYLGSVTSDARVFKQTMREISQADRNKLQKALVNSKNVIDNIFWIVNKGDDIPRYAEYRRTLKKTGDRLTAGRAAQEVTVNFRRGGKIAAEVNKIIPYFNAALQSLYQMFDNFFLKGYDEHLKTGSKKAAVGKLVPRYLMFLIGSLLSAALVQYWNRILAPELFGTDPNDFEKASSYMKNNYYLFAKPDGKFIRIPKPQNNAVIGSLIERSLDYFMYDDPNAYYNFMEYVGNSTLPPTSITLLETFIEYGKNENFAGIPIVPSYMENYDKRLQYDDTTSQVAYIIGQVFNLSPKQVDHFLTSNLGYIGRVNKNMFPMNRDNIDWTLGFENQFIVDSTYSTDIINRFYDERDEYTTMATSYNLTNGEDERYTYEDVYNKYKYDKYASLYSKVSVAVRDVADEEKKRAVRNYMNTTIGDMTNAGMTEVDEFVSYVIQEYGYEIDDIAPYITVPNSLYYKYQDEKGNNHYVYDDNKERIKNDLQYDDIMLYQKYFNDTIMPIYEKIIKLQGINTATGLPITDSDKAATMISVKDNLVKEMELIVGEELVNKYSK